MTKNVGKIDKIARLLVGGALLGLTVAGMIGPWGWIGVVPIVTALMGNCPAYSLLGVNTCQADK